MRRWLERLSFSFLIVALFLIWTGYNAINGHPPDVPTWQISLYFLGAGACIALFITGVRMRHQ